MKLANFIRLIFICLIFGCTTTPESTVKENVNPKYNVLRNGTRYVIYVADNEYNHTEAAIEIENRIKEYLGDRGLVLVDFDQNSLANILRNNGQISEGQAKQVSSSADLIITGRYRGENLEDNNINKAGTYRSRIRLSIAVTESNTAIEKARFQETCEEMASSFESAMLHTGIVCGNKVAEKVIDKLLYVYGH